MLINHPHSGTHSEKRCGLHTKTAPQCKISKQSLHHLGKVSAQPSVWVTPQLALISLSGIG